MEVTLPITDWPDGERPKR